jgi:hypothetical protein
LEKCQLKNEDGIIIFKSLYKNEKLFRLQIANNNFKEQTLFPYLLRLLKQNKTLKEIYLAQKDWLIPNEIWGESRLF